MKQPFAVLGISPLMPRKELEDTIEAYLNQIVELNEAYALNSFKLGTSYRMKSFGNKKVEDLLSKRYVYGLDLSQDVLGKDEVREFTKELEHKKNDTDNVSNKKYQINDIRLEMYIISALEILEMKGKVERAKQAYSENPNDISPLMDVLVEIKYKEKLIAMANALAQNLSEHGIAYTEQEFKETLINLEQYKRLEENYRQIKTREGRKQFIPEEYIQSQMYRSDYISTISQKDVKRLLTNEAKYFRQHIEEQEMIINNPELEEKLQIAINQDHDYSWGIVLQKPTYMLHNEPIDNPIFQGKISVEVLGYISEESLFRKRKYEQEVHTKSAKSSAVKRESKLSRLIMGRNELDTPAKSRTMRSYYYKNEATKTLGDYVLRVTKYDTSGQKSEHIIFSPVTYTGNESPEYLEFLKNVYFSDLMLGLARTNGGYAGRIERAPAGREQKYFISNKYNHDEIASAVLFSYGAPGKILDKRKPGQSRRYDPANKDTLNKLIDMMDYERGREIYE